MKILFFKSLTLLGLLVMGSHWGFAQVIVACDVEQQAWSGWNNICLPDGGDKKYPSGVIKKGERFSYGMVDTLIPKEVLKMRGLAGSFSFNIIGMGEDLASAKRSATANCRSMAMKIDPTGQVSLPEDFVCPIKACEEIHGPPWMDSPITKGGCICHRHGDHHVVGDQCIESPAVEMGEDGFEVSGQTMQSWFVQGFKICAEVAKYTGYAMSTHCGIDGKRPKSDK